jgi:hypothetical protein
LSDPTPGDGGFMLTVRGISEAGISRGRITSWRRAGGRRWTVTVYDLGAWPTGKPEEEAGDDGAR